MGYGSHYMVAVAVERTHTQYQGRAHVIKYGNFLKYSRTRTFMVTSDGLLSEYKLRYI